MESQTCLMVPEESGKKEVFRYGCDIPFSKPGHYGLSVRILPNHPDPESRHTMGLVLWAGKGLEAGDR